MKTLHSPATTMRVLAAFLMLSAVGAAEARSADVIKIATIAPRGSIYHRVLLEIGEAYRKARGGGAKAVVYSDSLQGTEADTVRRMRIGQLDGSMLSVVGLSQIDASVAALQFMPMMFRSWEEVDHVRETLRPELEAKMAAKGFEVLMWGEAGWVQLFTREPISMPDEFRRTRVWAWDGDPAQVDIMKSMDFRPVTLPVTDILPGLETGLIDTVPVAPMWALLGQFDRITRYMVRINWVPVIGATVIRKQRFEALSSDVRDAMLNASRVAAAKLRAHRSVQDEESIRAMQARGLTVRAATPEIERAWRKVAEIAWPKIRGSMVPAETFDTVRAIVTDYRARRN